VRSGASVIKSPLVDVWARGVHLRYDTFPRRRDSTYAPDVPVVTAGLAATGSGVQG
jgi:hypothetical protein